MTGARRTGQPKRPYAPAKTPEARENQLISAAVDLAERQLLEGTASPSVITHYLRLGSTKERLEKEKLENENALLRAKTQAIESDKRLESLFADAVAALKSYRSVDSQAETFDD